MGGKTGWLEEKTKRLTERHWSFHKFAIKGWTVSRREVTQERSWQLALVHKTTNISLWVWTLKCFVPGKWKWHLGPFIQLKQGSCTLLEWAKWRTYSLGSRFLSKLLETWCSTWPYFVKKNYQKLQQQKRCSYSSCVFSCGSRCCISQCAANILQHAFCGQEPQPSITPHSTTSWLLLWHWKAAYAWLLVLFWAYKCLS